MAVCWYSCTHLLSSSCSIFRFLSPKPSTASFAGRMEPTTPHTELPDPREGTRQSSTAPASQACPYEPVITETSPCVANNDRVTITLSFHKSNDFKWHKQNWVCKVPSLPTNTPLSKLPELLKGLVKQKTDSDPYIKRRLASRKSLLSLTIQLKVASNPRLGLITLDTDPRIEMLGDLFLDLTDVNLAVEISVGLRVHRTRSAPASVHEQILIAWPGHQEYQPFRIGNVSIHEEDGGYDQDPDLYAKRVGGRSDGPAYAQPLIAWRSSETGDVLLSRCHAYDFGNFCIGDPEDWTVWSRVRFSNKHHFLGQFEHVKWKGEGKSRFLERLEDHVEGNGAEEQLGSGVPFLPTYCFNEFKAEERGWGVETLSKAGIDVAVRCVNKCDTKSGLKNVSFPHDMRLVILDEDGFEDVEEIVKEEIAVTGTADEIKIDSGKLFEKRHLGKWRMELWVMPQQVGQDGSGDMVRDERKMFRYERGKLNQFLSPSTRVRSRDKMLFMEAHVVSSG